MISLISVYTLLQFTIVILEDLLSANDFVPVATALNWIELFILIVFLWEILLSAYAWGMKVVGTEIFFC